MAEKINILELDIDTDAIIKSTSNLKSVLDNAKDSLNAMKKAGDTSSATYVQQQAKVNRLSAEYRTSQRELTKLSSIQNVNNLSVKEAQNLLSVVKSQWENQANLYGENSKQVQALAKQKLELTNRLKKEEGATGDTTRNVGNYADGMKEAIKDTSFFGSEVTTVTRFLGSFSGVFDGVKAKAKEATAQIVGAAKGTQGLSKAQKAAAVTTNVVSGALKLFRLALISTGIGAIVVLLGSLVAYFSSTQKGIDAVSRAVTPLKVVFQTLFGVLQSVGESIASVFTADGLKQFGQGVVDFILAPFQTAWDTLKAIGKFMTGDFSGAMDDFKEIGSGIKESFDGMVDSIKNAAGEMSELMREAYERGQRIAELQIQIEESERDIIVTRAEMEAQLKRQETIAKDISKSSSDRQAAIEEQLKLASGIIEAENKILDLQIEQLKLKQASNDTSRDEEKELQELLAQRIKNTERLTNVEKKNLGAQNQLRKEIQTKAAKAQQDQIKSTKAQLKLFIESNKVRAKTLEEEVAIAEKVRIKKLGILESEIAAGKKLNAEAALERFQINQEFLDKQTEAVIGNADRELQIFIEGQQSKLDANQFFTDELLQQEEDRLNGIREKQLDHEALRLEQGIISQTEYNDAINSINAENDATIEALKLEREEAAKEKELIDLENQRAIDEENFLSDFERQTDRLNQMREQEIANAEKTGADTILINKKFDSLQRRLDDQERIRKVDSAQQMFGQLGGLAKSFFGESKALSTALALADTFLAAQKAYLSQFLPIPTPDSPARGAVAAGIATAQGLANVAQINGIKFEKGGMLEVGGNRHSQGGTKFVGEDGTTFEAEQGELIGVLNRRAAASFMKYNNGFLGGGATGHNYFANGGIVERNIGRSAQSSVKVISESVNPDVLAAKLAEAYSSLPSPQVAVTDINNSQDDLVELIDGANI